MSIKVGVLSPDLDKQIALLKLYPEIAEQHFRPAMDEAVVLASAAIVSGIPVATGHAIETFGTKVTGKGLNLVGQVGWWGQHSAWYINIVESGAMPHPLNSGVSIRSSHAKQRLFNAAFKSGSINENPGGQHVMVGGEWKTMKAHPGFAGRHFMKDGFEEVQPGIEVVFQAANEAVAQELALP